MKVLLSTYFYLPHVGGVSTYVDVLKQELERMGHEVDVFAHHPDMQITIWRIPEAFWKNGKSKILFIKK
jgi:glycosyltransferase involved in cell wall biosynthesis